MVSSPPCGIGARKMLAPLVTTNMTHDGKQSSILRIPTEKCPEHVSQFLHVVLLRGVDLDDLAIDVNAGFDREIVEVQRAAGEISCIGGAIGDMMKVVLIVVNGNTACIKNDDGFGARGLSLGWW